MIRIIVIGATGFIGSHTYKFAKSLAMTDVIGTSRKRTKGLLKFDMKDDITKALPKRFMGQRRTYAIICSAVRGMDDCKTNPEGTRKVNVIETIQLIKRLADNGIKPLFISTSSVFDGRKGNYTEDNKPNPVCEYGRQKREVETYILKNHPEAMIIRLDKIIGDDPDEKHLLTEWDNQIKLRQPIKVLKNQYFSATNVDDVARALVLVCLFDLSGLYHFCNPEAVTRKDLAKLFVKLSGRRTKINELDYKELGLKDKRPLRTNMIITKFMTTVVEFKFTKNEETIKKYLEKVKL
jgi:dTDP-4-dehydrorhamnose reductase